jgi:hypothetical protein
MSPFSPARPRRLLHPPALSLPRQPLYPGTHLFPCIVLETREVNLVIRRRLARLARKAGRVGSFIFASRALLARLAHDSRTTNDKDGLFD